MICIFLEKKIALMQSKAVLEAGHDREICGLILDNGYFLDFVLLRNRDKNIGKFSFYAREVKKIKQASKLLDIKIIGTFHSHPWSSADPSKSDIKNALEDSLLMIFSVPDKTAKLWYIKDNEATLVSYSKINSRKNKGWYRD